MNRLESFDACMQMAQNLAPDKLLHCVDPEAVPFRYALFGVLSAARVEAVQHRSANHTLYESSRQGFDIRISHVPSSEIPGEDLGVMAVCIWEPEKGVSDHYMSELEYDIDVPQPHLTLVQDDEAPTIDTAVTLLSESIHGDGGNGPDFEFYIRSSADSEMSKLGRMLDDQLVGFTQAPTTIGHSNANRAIDLPNATRTLKLFVENSGPRPPSDCADVAAGTSNVIELRQRGSEPRTQDPTTTSAA